MACVDTKIRGFSAPYYSERNVTNNYESTSIQKSDLRKTIFDFYRCFVVK